MIEQGSNQAFSGIIQLRCTNAEKLELCLKYVKKLAEKDKHASPISKITLEKNGYDVYIVPRSILNRLQRLLPLSFGGTVNTTKRLVTRNHLTSKELHRMYLLFRCFPFSQGQTVKLDDKPLKLLKVSKQITALELASGRRIKLEPGQKLELLRRFKAHVASTKPRLELLHPVTFQPVIPENSPIKKALAYDVVVIEDKLYIVT